MMTMMPVSVMNVANTVLVMRVDVGNVMRSHPTMLVPIVANIVLRKRRDVKNVISST